MNNKGILYLIVYLGFVISPSIFAAPIKPLDGLDDEEPRI
jgi:hypothetical protein